MATVKVFMPDEIGNTSHTLYLYKSSDGTLLNTGGDALTETGASGWFSATVAETLAETYGGFVHNSAAALVHYGFLYLTTTVLDSSTAVSTVSVSSVTSVSRHVGSTLKAYVGEDVTFPPLATYDVDGTILDTTAITLEVIIEGRRGKADVVVIADGSLTKTSTTVQFTSTSAANTSEAQKTWAVRRTDSNTVVNSGEYVVDYAANNDA